MPPICTKGNRGAALAKLQEGTKFKLLFFVRYMLCLHLCWSGLSLLGWGLICFATRMTRLLPKDTFVEGQLHVRLQHYTLYSCLAVLARLHFHFCWRSGQQM